MIPSGVTEIETEIETGRAHEERVSLSGTGFVNRATMTATETLDVHILVVVVTLKHTTLRSDVIAMTPNVMLRRTI